jgi:hypothetical protein
VQRTRIFLLAGGFDSSKNLALAVGVITAPACELWYTGCALNSAVCDAVAPDVDLRISAFSFLRKSYA